MRRFIPLVLIPAIALGGLRSACGRGPAPRSRSEMDILEKAGRDRTQIGARSTAGDPDTRVVDKGPTTVAILNAPEQDSQVASAQVPQ